MRRLRFKSLYFKWILLFTGLILVAQVFSLIFALQYVFPEVQSNLSEKLYRKAVFLQELSTNGTPITDEILTHTGDTDIHFYLFDMDAVPEEVGRYRKIISLEMLHRASGGEIVSSYEAGGVKMPFCLLSLDQKIALLTPNYYNNELTFFIGAYQRCMISSAFFASVLIVCALLVIIRPIKKVTQATREVAGGNFNVQLTTRSVDEVGELIHNFNIMTQVLHKNEYLKKDFVSNVSHEFKTPITSIEGFARLMKKESVTRGELNEYADIIIKEATRLSALSSNLLQLSLLDSGVFEPMRTTFLLDEQIRESILLLQSKWEGKDIEFDIRMDEITVCGPEELLSHVWMNLFDNAIKFSPQGGVITVEAGHTNLGVSVSVTDDGPGIPPDTIGRIFDRFYKTDPSRSQEGSGLGLSIVKHILEISGGSITANTTHRRGACFTVLLPNPSVNRP